MGVNCNVCWASPMISQGIGSFVILRWILLAGGKNPPLYFRLVRRDGAWKDKNSTIWFSLLCKQVCDNKSLAYSFAYMETGSYIPLCWHMPFLGCSICVMLSCQTWQTIPELSMISALTEKRHNKHFNITWTIQSNRSEAVKQLHSL